MKRKKIFPAIILVTAIFIGCKKEQVMKNPGNPYSGTESTTSSASDARLPGTCPITTGVSVTNGLLSFATISDFNNVVKDIQLKHDSLCNQDTTDFYQVSKCFESQFNYVSLRSIIHASNVTALNNEVYDIQNDLDNKYFPHTGIRTVCNSKGEVKIDGKLHIYTESGDIFIVNNGSTEYTDDINSSVFTNLNNVRRFLVDGSELFYTNGNATTVSARKECKTWLKINNKYYSNGKRMIRLSNWTLNAPTLNTSGSETWVYRKVGPTWVLAWVSGLNVNYGGDIHNKNCDWMVFMSGANSGNNNHHRRAANDVWTSNGFAMNVARSVVKNTYGGNAWASGSGVLNITVN